jgi:hypothetical protein
MTPDQKDRLVSLLQLPLGARFAITHFEAAMAPVDMKARLRSLSLLPSTSRPRC